MPVRSEAPMSVCAPSIRRSSPTSRVLALSTALLVVVASAWTAQTSLVPAVVERAVAVGQNAARGFEAMTGNIPSRIAASIMAANERAASSRARATHRIVLATGQTQIVIPDLNTLSLLSATRMAVSTTSSQAHGTLATVERSTHAVGRTSAADLLRSSLALVHNPSRIPLALVVANRAVGEGIIRATHAAVEGDVRAVYILAALGPETARATVMAIGTVGLTTERLAVTIPTVTMRVT
ncbi:MAG TPA: hypothetical protein VJK73_00555, partial [Candidatus Paceibacterota bacterium]